MKIVDDFVIFEELVAGKSYKFGLWPLAIGPLFSYQAAMFKAIDQYGTDLEKVRMNAPDAWGAINVTANSLRTATRQVLMDIDPNLVPGPREEIKEWTLENRELIYWALLAVMNKAVARLRVLAPGEFPAGQIPKVDQMDLVQKYGRRTTGTVPFENLFYFADRPLYKGIANDLAIPFKAVSWDLPLTADLKKIHGLFPIEVNVTTTIKLMLDGKYADEPRFGQVAKAVKKEFLNHVGDLVINLQDTFS